MPPNFDNYWKKYYEDKERESYELFQRRVTGIDETPDIPEDLKKAVDVFVAASPIGQTKKALKNIYGMAENLHGAFQSMMGAYQMAETGTDITGRRYTQKERDELMRYAVGQGTKLSLQYKFLPEVTGGMMKYWGPKVGRGIVKIMDKISGEARHQQAVAELAKGIDNKIDMLAERRELKDWGRTLSTKELNKLGTTEPELLDIKQAPIQYQVAAKAKANFMKTVLNMVEKNMAARVRINYSPMQVVRTISSEYIDKVPAWVKADTRLFAQSQSKFASTLARLYASQPTMSPTYAVQVASYAAIAAINKQARPTVITPIKPERVGIAKPEEPVHPLAGEVAKPEQLQAQEEYYNDYVKKIAEAGRQPPTEPEAPTVEPARLPPKGPIGGGIARQPEEAPIKFSEPTAAKWITPSDAYLRALGTYELVEPLIENRMRMQVEVRNLSKWLDKEEGAWNKLQRQGFGHKAVKWLKNQPTWAQNKMWNWLNTYKGSGELRRGIPDVTPDEIRLFEHLRGFTNEMLNRVNEIRREVGLGEIPNIGAYIMHIYDVMGKARLREKYPFPEDVKYWLNFVPRKHLFNPTALKRYVEGHPQLLKNPFKALKAMAYADLKQIYLEKPNILFRDGLEYFRGMIPETAEKYTMAYVNEAVMGMPTHLDKLTNATLDRLHVTGIIDGLMKPFGRKLGVNPAQQMAGAVSRLVHDAVIWGRLKLVIRNHTQKFLTLGMYGSQSWVKGILPMNETMRGYYDKSDFVRLSKREFMEQLPKDVVSKIEKLGFIPYGWSHISNVAQAWKTGWHWAKSMGWSDTDAAKEADFGANTTQYWYNMMGMPELYRSGLLRGLFVLQSWFMNYTMKYWRELLHRAFTGRTGWGKKLDVEGGRKGTFRGRLKGTSARLSAMRHIITSLIFIEGARRALGLDYRRIALLGVLPTYLSPPGQLANGLLAYITAPNEWERKKAEWKMKTSYSAFIPGSLAWRDFMKAWDDGDVRQLLFYVEKKKKEEPKSFDEMFEEKVRSENRIEKSDFDKYWNKYQNQ